MTDQRWFLVGAFILGLLLGLSLHRYAPCGNGCSLDTFTGEIKIYGR